MEKQKTLTGGSMISVEEGKSLMKNLGFEKDEPANNAADLAFDQQFKPRGAVAFFALLVLLGMVIWFGIYFLMLSRV